MRKYPKQIVGGILAGMNQNGGREEEVPIHSLRDRISSSIAESED